MSVTGKQPGLTLIEIMLIIGIFALLISIMTPVGLNFYLAYQFDSETDLLTALLRQARNLSMVNHNESDHGVYIAADKFTVFEGTNYATRNQASDKQFQRDGAIAIAGPAEIVFSALSGQTASSTFNLNDGRKNRDIFVNPEGLVYE